MTPQEIHDDMVPIFAEDSLSYASVKKWAAEFCLQDGSQEC